MYQAGLPAPCCLCSDLVSRVPCEPDCQPASGCVPAYRCGARVGRYCFFLFGVGGIHQSGQSSGICRAGDNIGIEADGSISINGRVIAGSAARRQDSRGRPIPAPLLQAGIVPPGRALALALRNPGSFDGRYFGLTSLAGMQVVRPVWIFE